MHYAPTTSNTSPPFDHDNIARLAYAYWEQRGRPHGSPEIDWYRAIEDVERMNALNANLVMSEDFEDKAT